MDKQLSAGEPVFRSVQKQGGTRVLSVGRILPPHWRIVQIKILEQTKTCITLQIVPMSEEVQSADPLSPGATK